METGILPSPSPPPKSFPLSFVCGKEVSSEPNKRAREDFKLKLTKPVSVNTLCLDKELYQETPSLFHSEIYC